MEDHNPDRISMTHTHAAGKNCWRTYSACATAKKRKDSNVWLIHFFADHVESVDMETIFPYAEMTSLIQHWILTIDHKFGKKE